jgi:hypothetical protein
LVLPFAAFQAELEEKKIQKVKKDSDQLSGRVVEHSLHLPKVKGLSQAGLGGTRI